MNKRMCKYYQHPKICTYKDVCGEKLITPNAVHCCSNLYYSMGLEQECETLKSENFTFEELVKTQDEQLEPFNGGYIEHLDTKMIADLAKKSIRLTTENRKLENALEEIEEIAKNDCENCCECSTEFNLQESCSIYEIQNIINKAKDGK